MAIGTQRAFALIAFLVLAPLLAAAILMALLLLGVEPHLVFLPGHFVRSRLAAAGVQTPNAVGVVTTFIVWWVGVVVIWLALRRLRPRAA